MQSEQVLEWKAEEKAEALLRLLKLRFRDPLPAEVVDRITAAAGLKSLNRWFDAAATAATLEEFQQSMGPE